jgi:hypothetical protein
MIDHIEPGWDLREFRDLRYSLNCYRDAGVIDQYVAAGHSRHSMRLWTYYDPQPMPAGVETVRQRFQEILDSVTVAVNLFVVGQYVPPHSDLYGRYNELFNPQGRDILRAMVMLEPGVPGQILEIGDQCYSSWRAGDVFWWRDQDQHAFYNMSLQDRYALQITGLIRDDR